MAALKLDRKLLEKDSGKQNLNRLDQDERYIESANLANKRIEKNRNGFAAA